MKTPWKFKISKWTVWSIPNKKKHELAWKLPNKKPLKVLKRIIQLSTKPNDKILSIFSGSGSGACAAIETNRNSVSVENNFDTLKHSKQRILDIYVIGQMSHNVNYSALSGLI